MTCLLLGGLMLVGCPIRNGDDDAGGYDAGRRDAAIDDGGNPNRLKVKDLQDSTSPRFPGAEAQVALTDLVVSSQMFSVSSALEGFFVSDAEGGAFSGILVTVATGEVTVARNDLVDVEGTLVEFTGQTGNTGTETQLEATHVTVRGTGSVAATVANAADLVADATAEAWEGVLVRVEGVSTVLFPDGSLVSFGQFQVTGGALVDDQLFEYVPGAQEVFTSITGVLRYTYYGDYVLMPRDAADVVSLSGARVITDSSPAAVQNPADPNHPEVCATTSLRCNPVRLTQMVVTSTVFGVSDESTCLDEEKTSGGYCPYYMYGFFVADPSAVDANGRLQAWSGIKITVIPGVRWRRGTACDGLSGTALVDCGQAGTVTDGFDTNYTFTGHFVKNATLQNMLDGFPQVGDIITLVGEPAEYYDMTQLSRLEVLTRLGSTNDATPLVAMPLPALFDGDVSTIYSGMPRVPESGNPEVRPALLPGPDTEKYEGVLVELRNVQLLDLCVGYPYSNNVNDIRDFGYFRVAGASATSLHGVEIGTFFRHGWGGWWRSPSTTGAPAYTERTCDNLVNKCEDRRQPGQSFSSIIGLMDYSYGVHRLEPASIFEINCAQNCAENPSPAFCQ
ncbi:MAG: hypothetical protein ABIJ09_24975 [Pseudomonadota bacterium]